MSAQPRLSRSTILGLVAGYASAASLWILLSDKALQWLFTDPARLVQASTLKGGAFVLVTSLLLFWLLRRVTAAPARPTASAPARVRLAPSLPFLLLASTILALTGIAVGHNFINHRDQETARLQAIADLRARQIEDWVSERTGEAGYIPYNQAWHDIYLRWRTQGDRLSRDLLYNRLKEFREQDDFQDVLILGEQGEPLWSSWGDARALEPALREIARRSVADRLIRLLGPYRDADGQLRLDIVSPLPQVKGRPREILVFRSDPESFLFPTLKAWPAPSTSGETLLFRRDGDQVQFLNQLRHQKDAKKDTSLRLRLPLATPRMLSAQILRGEAKPGQLVEGTDYRGVKAMGVAQAVSGTDWILLAKLDRTELFAEAAQDAVWIGLTGVLALIMASVGFHLLRQRQQLALADDVRQNQEERLRALRLLAAIADSSDDAIFAKDLEGRYILFNRAASKFVGKPAEEVLGKDDRALFPAEQAEMLMATSRQVIAEGRPVTQEELLTTPDGERAFLATKGLLRDGEGKIIGVFGISRDIADQKEAEAALQVSEMSYRSLFENMMNGYAYCRMIFQNGDPRDFIYLAVNQAFEAQTGLHGVVGRRVSAIIPGIRERDPELFEICGRVARGGPPQRFEIQLAALNMWFSISVYSPRQEYFVAVFDVITERKQAELALRESEGRFRALVEQSLAGIYIIQDGRFRYVNPGLAAIFGYDAPEALIDRVAVTDLVDPADRARVAENLRQRMAAETTDIHYTFTGLRREGSRIDVEVHGRVFDYQGHPAVIGLILDITARKAAEDSLRASELRFHDIVKASADWVWEVDAQGRYTYASESVQDLLGYSAAEILGKTPFDLMPPEEAERVRAVFAEISTDGAPFRDLDNITRHKDGSLRHVQSNGMPMLDGAGKLLGYRGLDKDITERKKAELILRESEASFRTLFDTAAVTIMVHDPDTGAVVEANRRAIEAYGYTTLEELQQNDFWLEPPYSLAEALDLIHKAVREGPQRFEWKSRDRQGRIIWEDVLLNRVNLNGIERVLAITTDITARKAAEEALYRQAEELRSRNEELERFNRATVGRELDMVALKQQINALSIRLGQAPPYSLAFLDDPAARPKGEKTP